MPELATDNRSEPGTTRDIVPALVRAVERLATELYRGAPDRTVASATTEAIGATVGALLRRGSDRLAPGVSPQPRGPELACVESALDSIAPEHTGADVPELYQRLLTYRPVCEKRGAEIRLRQATDSSRRRLGSFYTPGPLVDHLLQTSLGRVVEDRLASVPGDPRSPQGARRRQDAILSIRVCDPACGSGRFLLGARELLARRLARELSTIDPAASSALERARVDVLSQCIYGVDIDPTAVTLCRDALCDGAAHPRVTQAAERNIRVGDALLWAPAEQLREMAPSNEGLAARRFEWDREFPAIFMDDSRARPGFDVVVGNPPFLNQLERSTSIDRSYARALGAIYDGATGGYADLAAAFILLARRLTAPGGRLAMVMPQSFLAARDARPARRRLLEHASLESLWVSNIRVFPGASVLTCAPTLHVTNHPNRIVRRYSSARCTASDPVHIDPDELAEAPTWSGLIVSAAGVPEFDLAPAPTLGSLCHATADFRDQYYGLEGFIVEHDEIPDQQEHQPGAFPPIVTSGLIDPAQCRWGAAACRLLKSRWRAPCIDLRRMRRDGSLAPWIESRLLPKLIVATQTRTIEVFADPDGRYVPSVPLISVLPNDRSAFWRVGAALASPVLAACALRRHAGAALHADAIKLSAKQLLALPCPTHHTQWASAAESFRLASGAQSDAERDARLCELGVSSCAAYGLTPDETDELMSWWRPRLPRRS